MKRHLATVILVLIAVASVGVVIATGGRVTTSEKEARADNVLVAYREPDITRIEIEHPGKPKLVLERTPPDDAGDTDWKIVEPMRDDAEADVVNQLTGALEFAATVRRIKPEEVDRHAFGLDAPRMIVRIAMGKISYVLSLGKDAASPKGAAYLDVSGDGVPDKGVCIVKESFVKELDIGSDQLRGRLMMPYVSTVLSHLALDGQGGARKLVKASWNGWRFDGMQGNLRVDRQSLDRVLLQLARTKADHFIDPGVAAKAQVGSDTVSVTMIPERKSEPRAVVIVGGACPDSKDDVVALRTEPDRLAACVPSNVMPGLATPAADLVDRTLFSIRKDEVESMSVSRGDKKLEMDRAGSGFLMRQPRRADVELDAGNERIGELVDVHGELQDGAAFDKPDGRITLKSAGASDAKAVEETVRIGKAASDGSVLVMREADGAVLKLDRASARALAPDASLIRSRKILEFSGGDLTRLEIRVGDAHEELVQDSALSLELSKPKDVGTDAGLVADLVNALSALSADRWVADEDDGSFGLDKPVTELKLVIGKKDAGVTTQRIVIGARTNGGAFASIDGDPGVFVLPKDVLEKVETLVFDRSPFMLPLDAARVEIEHGTDHVALERRGDVFVQSGGTDLGAARVHRLVEALTTLRAEAAIHVGAAKPGEGFAKPELVVHVTTSSGDGGTDRKIVWRIGAGDSWRDVSIYYARAEGTDATYVIARSKVREVVDAL